LGRRRSCLGGLADEACGFLRRFQHGSRKLEQPVFHRAAAEENFFLRGFHHLLVFKKERRRAAGDGR